MNSRVRYRGLSAKEIVTCRDQVTNSALSIDDKLLSQKQEEHRDRNHPASARSKAPNAKPASVPSIATGSLVFIKSEGDKFHPRELYVVVSIDDKRATLQKLHGKRFMSKQYTIPLNTIYPLSAGMAPPSADVDVSSDSESESDDEDDDIVCEGVESENVEDGVCENEASDNVEVPTGSSSRYPSRQRRPPDWLRSDEWET